MESPLQNAQKPILGIAAFSGTGKTTILRALLPILKQRGLRVGMIKHAHHKFEIDTPGKDSYELRKAGADVMLVTSSHRWALMVDKDDAAEATLDEALENLPQAALDLVLVEGFKHESFPKIELNRPALGHPLLFPDDPRIVAIAVDEPLDRACELPILDLNQTAQIADFICDWITE